jgi:nitroimidazol reductase NimA-like FMN-containing flavoprotein (pyridoxamine 5'-phosphate oxidase superfamily)
MARPETSDEVRGARMDDAEIAGFLAEQGTGVLALADGGQAYAIPISFGYQEGSAYFGYFRFGDDSEKQRYSAATEQACLTVYEIDSQFDWRSVLAFGDLRELSQEEWSLVGEAINDNAWSPDLSTLGKRSSPSPATNSRSRT